MGSARLRSGRLQVERLDSGRRRLLRDLVVAVRPPLGRVAHLKRGFFYVDEPTAETQVTVPDGFETDFSSIPAVFRGLYRFDTVDLAGICHDWAYWIGVPRADADRLWRVVATSGSARVSTWKGWAGWVALRVGGWVAYRNHARARRLRQQRG